MSDRHFHEHRHGEDPGFRVKPSSFVEVSKDMGKRLDPPLDESSIESLSREYDVSLPQLSRLGLFVYGIDPGDHRITGRQDGVIAGIDTFVSNSDKLTKAVSEGQPDIDLDSGRLAVFASKSEETPYLWKDNQVLSNGDPTGLFMTEFPKDSFNGRYYVRTDSNGDRNRLVVNPRPSCESNCKWCARAYPDRMKLLNERLDRRIMPPEQLVEQILNDVEMNKIGGIKSMKEVNFVSGDFLQRESISQTDYLISFVKQLKNNGFSGDWYYAGHQVFKEKRLREIADEIGTGRLCYTLEHLTRRPELMPIKGQTSLNEVSLHLKEASSIIGPENTEYYLISGLDPSKKVVDWISEHKDIAVPQVHVFTPYAPSHFQMPLGTRRDQLVTALDIRKSIIEIYGHGINAGSNRSLFTLQESN